MWNQAPSVSTTTGAENRRLFVGGLPRYRKREEIHRELSKLVDGLTDVILYPSAADKTKNRGFAFAEFASYEEAQAARYKLVTSRAQLWGKPVCVDWAAPEPQVDESLMANVKVLYVRNLMLSTTEDTIRAFFDTRHPGTVERVKKMKDFAFVHYSERRFALANLVALNGTVLENAVIEVQLAKPVQKPPNTPASIGFPPRSPNLISSSSPNLPNIPFSCLSLPPNMAAAIANGQLSSASSRGSPASFTNGGMTPTPGPQFTFPPPQRQNPQVASELAQLEAQMRSLLYQPSEMGPGTPFPQPGDINTVIANQKHKVELLAMQNSLEMEKLRVLQQEQELKEAWARHCAMRSQNQMNPALPAQVPNNLAVPPAGHHGLSSYNHTDFQPRLSNGNGMGMPKPTSPGNGRLAGGASADNCLPPGLDWDSLIASNFGLTTDDVDEVIRAAAGAPGDPKTRGAVGAHLSAPFFASSPKVSGMGGSRIGETGESRGSSPQHPGEMTGLSAIVGTGAGGYWSNGSSPSSIHSNAATGQGHNTRSTLDSGIGFEASLNLH